jgi:hypothetical protein
MIYSKTGNNIKPRLAQKQHQFGFLFKKNNKNDMEDAFVAKKQHNSWQMGAF